ncbi:hypothetical protein Acr_00g0085590 [Actinidia rufa]|uniref:Uncharacterized protein n=1 Tax=Actinidia rufa TaxID=165716 RepID=A0A7J0DVJ2_9ERIC|nr:hypothetical protein Acr_00g0085590 [Actinidia rufa]
MRVPHKVLVTDLPAFTLGMEGEDGRTNKYRGNVSTKQKFKDLDSQIDAIDIGVKVRVSSRFKLPPQLGIYEGKMDPMDHLDLAKNGQCDVQSLLNNSKRADEKAGKRFKEYVKRFNQVVLEVEAPNDIVVIMAMIEGLHLGALFDSLSKNMPKTLSILQVKANKYIVAEEWTEAKQNRQGKQEDYERKEPDSKRIDYRCNLKSRKPEMDAKRRDHD